METKIAELEDLHKQLEQQVDRISVLIERLVGRIEGLEKRVQSNTEKISNVALAADGGTES